MGFESGNFNNNEGIIPETKKGEKNLAEQLVDKVPDVGNFSEQTRDFLSYWV